MLRMSTPRLKLKLGFHMVSWFLDVSLEKRDEGFSSEPLLLLVGHLDPLQIDGRRSNGFAHLDGIPGAVLTFERTNEHLCGQQDLHRVACWTWTNEAMEVDER